MLKYLIFLLLVGLLPGVITAGTDDSLLQFKSNYDALNRLVLDRSGEIAAIDSFTYQKDVATYHFGKGTMLLQRPVLGRPTLAIFVGHGHAHVDIPVTAERAAYEMLAGDTVVDDSFSICLMRIGDDFDARIKSAYTFVQGQMSIADFGHVRDAQLEYYFKPTLYNQYDNQLQLLISAYERKTDGYFWASFGHTVFKFDPNAPEEVQVWHMREPEFALGSAGPRFQRRESNCYSDGPLSTLNYLVAELNQSADVRLGGADGWVLDTAAIQLVLTVRRDSLRFVPLFFDPHFDPDSVSCNGARVGFFRRKDFYHATLLLPRYARRSDTLTVTIWFHNAGEDYHYLLPWVDNSLMPTHSLRLTYPSGYNYVLPQSSSAVKVDNNHEQIAAGPVRCFELPFRPLPTGFDTSVVDVDSQMSLVFISGKGKTWVAGDDYQREAKNACHYFLQNFGVPSGERNWYVFPGGLGAGYGVFWFPMTYGDKLLGGLPAVAGQAVSRVWTEPTLQMSSYREEWLKSSLEQFLGMLYAQKVAGSPTMYNNLSRRRRYLETVIDNKRDLPLALGTRGDQADLTDKGVWLLHMLRVLMFDVETRSDDKFTAMIKELMRLGEQCPVSNADFCSLAEKHFGGRLDWFFDPWLNGRNMPEFSGTWSIEQADTQYWVNLSVQTKGVPANEVFPVMLDISFPGSSALLRQAIAGTQTEYRVGPFAGKPTKVVFNEYSSVLCKADVNEK